VHETFSPYVRYNIFTAVKIQVVLWVMVPCSDVVGYQHFGEHCCLHLQKIYSYWPLHKFWIQPPTPG